MKFADFLGNDDSVNRLKSSIINNRTFHAYIFEGAEGSGKRLLAYTLAQSLLCKNLSYEGEPCQICSACKKVINGNHSDVHFITPEGSSIKDEQIENLQEILFSKPFDGDKTILIIDKADSMTVRAQNRLLKTLEEPAVSVTILLLTERIGDLIPTIVSRSAVIRLKPVDRKIIKEFLIKNIKVETEDAEIAAAYCCGSTGKAVRLLKDENFIERRKNSIKCACGIIDEKTLAEFMLLFDEDSLKKDNIMELLDMMSFWYRDILFISQGLDSEYIMNKDYYNKLINIQKKIDLKKICKILENIEDAKYDIMMNVNINYALKNMYLELNN